MIFKGDNKELTLAIKKAQLDTNTPNSKMAQNLNVPQQTISRRINGNNSTVKSLYELAEAMGCDLEINFIPKSDGGAENRF